AHHHAYPSVCDAAGEGARCVVRGWLPRAHGDASLRTHARARNRARQLARTRGMAAAVWVILRTTKPKPISLDDLATVTCGCKQKAAAAMSVARGGCCGGDGGEVSVEVASGGAQPQQVG